MRRGSPLFCSCWVLGTALIYQLSAVRTLQDKDSMLRLVQVIDQALGYVAPTPPDHSSSPEFDDNSAPHPHSHSHASAHAHHHASQAPSTQPLSNLYHTSTVQEKWVDYPKEYRDFERENWKKEGELAIARANEDSRRRAGVTKEMPDGGGEGMDLR